MARRAEAVHENAPGDWFVDRSCIDCSTCRIVAPEVFADAGTCSYVRRQPAGARERELAAMAQVACPTASIGGGTAADVRAAASRFPVEVAPSVFFCGYTSVDSYGASSWLVRRPGGNVLVDSPRAARPLIERLRAMGGVRWMVLTHRDDVADHAVFARELGCERVMHAADVGRETAAVERRVEGEEAVALDADLLMIPVPGHTRGSVALLHGDTLFTGDHLWSDDGVRLHASRSVCWYSWREQRRSVEKLLRWRFRRVLPGHGGRWEGDSDAALRDLLGRM